MASIQTCPDKELMILLKSGSHAAFAEIYDRYWGLMYVHALKMLGDEDEAKDIIQELFITLWTKGPELELKNSLSGYLYVSVRHKILNRIRQQKTGSSFIHALALYISENENSFLPQLHEKELSAVIEKEIEKLPSKMRRIFEMSRKEYLSHKEIAEALDISDKTVKKQISNALKILKMNQEILQRIIAAITISAFI